MADKIKPTAAKSPALRGILKANRLDAGSALKAVWNLCAFSMYDNQGKIMNDLKELQEGSPVDQFLSMAADGYVTTWAECFEILNVVAGRAKQVRHAYNALSDSQFLAITIDVPLTQIEHDNIAKKFIEISDKVCLAQEYHQRRAHLLELKMSQVSA